MDAHMKVAIFRELRFFSTLLVV